MAKGLKENLNSAYFGAAHKLYSRKARKRIIAYVESYDDIAFWRNLLEKYETEEFCFQVMLPSATSLSKGKKMVLINTLNTEELGRNLIACVDSDYDYLLQEATRTSRKINRSRYIFQTYAYAIENLRCYADSLHEVCVQATLNDRHIIDFKEFLKQYSRIIYPLFVWSVFFYRKHDTHTFPIHEFCHCTGLYDVKLSKIQECLSAVQNRVQLRRDRLCKDYPSHLPKIKELENELSLLGVTPDNTYLFIQGHHLEKNVVLKVLSAVCGVLRREREREIRELAEHNIQFRNELTGYQNSQINVELILKRNTGYRKMFLFKKIEKDIEAFLRQR